VDGEVERLALAALAPDRIALAVAALGELEEEARLLERQWSLKRERTRYEAERARRQYDAVEPENRLVARSLERAWEERLRQVEQIEAEYAGWRRAQPLSLTDADRAQILSLGEDLPRLWNAATTTAAERKQMLRLKRAQSLSKGARSARMTGTLSCQPGDASTSPEYARWSRCGRTFGALLKEVVLDQRRERGQVWIRIVWQTGATSEHRIQRCVHAYTEYAALERLQARVRELNAAQKMDGEIAPILNAEGLVSARGRPFSGAEIHLLRKRWGIPTVKINGKEANPQRWPDGTYSVQGAAKVLTITAQIVFKWLQKGRLTGQQLAKGMPWKIILFDEQIPVLKALVRHITRSKKEAP
jgi:hypothetical protein